MTNSSNKGSAFERKVCKELSLWWTEDKRDDVFWRTSQSGGRATTRRKKSQKTAYSYGDVTFIDPIGKPFIDNCLLELKCGYTNEIEVLDFIDKTKGKPQLLKWWEKAEKENKIAKREYILIIFKRNFHKPCVFISQQLLSKMISYFGGFDNVIKINMNDRRFTIILFDEFLNKCNSNFFKN